jgi:hypothetical protein
MVTFLEALAEESQKHTGLLQLIDSKLDLLLGFNSADKL